MKRGEGKEEGKGRDTTGTPDLVDDGLQLAQSACGCGFVHPGQGGKVVRKGALNVHDHLLRFLWRARRREQEEEEENQIKQAAENGEESKERGHLLGVAREFALDVQAAQHVAKVAVRQAHTGLPPCVDVQAKQGGNSQESRGMCESKAGRGRGEKRHQRVGRVTEGGEKGLVRHTRKKKEKMILK